MPTARYVLRSRVVRGAGPGTHFEPAHAHRHVQSPAGGGNAPVYNTTNTDVNFGIFSINSSILPSSLANTEQDETSTTKLSVTRLFGSANVPTRQVFRTFKKGIAHCNDLAIVLKKWANRTSVEPLFSRHCKSIDT